MQLCLKLQQNVSKYRMGGHLQTNGELLKNHNFIELGLQSNLLPRLMAYSLGKITMIDHPVNAADRHGRRPKQVALYAGTLVRAATNTAVRARVAQHRRHQPISRTFTPTILATKTRCTISKMGNVLDVSHHKCRKSAKLPPVVSAQKSEAKCKSKKAGGGE
jgi:hypothetical protein